MKNIIAFCLILLICFSFVACQNDSADSNQDKAKETTTTNEQVSSSTLFEDIIMDNIDEWETANDEYTKQYTYDELKVSCFYLFSTGNQKEFYFVTGYALPGKSLMTSDFTYAKVYYLTEDSFEYLYNSGDDEYYDMTKNSKLFGTTTFSDSEKDKGKYLTSFLEESLQQAEKYYSEINIGETQQVTLSEDEMKLYNNMLNTISLSDKYTWQNTDFPLTRIEYYDLGNGSCEALFCYGSDVRYFEKGYYIDEIGFSDLSDEAVERLYNTTGKKVLNWNVEWTSEKKEYMLKESIENK